MCIIIDWCNQNSGFLMVVITIIYAFVTTLILMSNRKANQIAQYEIDTLKKFHIDERRPYLTSKKENDNWLLENIGKNTAYSIHIRTVPPCCELNYLALKIEIEEEFTLAPQASRRIGFFIQSDGVNGVFEFQCILTYKDTMGNEYSDETTVDIR